MTTLAQQLRELSNRLQHINEGEDQPPASYTAQMNFFKQHGSGYIPPKLPEIKPAGSPNFYSMLTTDGQTVWIYGTKVDPACTEPVDATLNGSPVTVMKMPGQHPDHESRGYIVKP